MTAVVHRVATLSRLTSPVVLRAPLCVSRMKNGQRVLTTYPRVIYFLVLARGIVRHKCIPYRR